VSTAIVVERLRAERDVALTEVDLLRTRIGAVLALRHALSAVTPYCVLCAVPCPCPTVRAATIPRTVSACSEVPQHDRYATTKESTMNPCRGCGDTGQGPADHVYGERKCCPDCDHRPVSDYSAAQILAAISLAIKANDMPAAAGLVRMLAVVSPKDAEMILLALDLVRANTA
jgi:hypothetical protein